MSKKTTLMSVCLFLFLVSILNAETSGKKQVAVSGETVIAAKSPQFNVRVRIKTLNIEKDVTRKWGKQLPFIPSTCTFSSWCSVVTELDISVNGKQIFVPHSLIADLAIIDTAEIRLEKENMMLLLEEGDASESYYDKIEFDRDRVKRKLLSADESMAQSELLQDTKYYLVTH